MSYKDYLRIVLGHTEGSEIQGLRVRDLRFRGLREGF